MKTTQKQLKLIKDKLWQKRILDLSPREICIYTLYRIEELTRTGIAVSNNEIKYNLCEVGPGNRRLDPWSLEIVTMSASFNRLSTLGSQDRAGIRFFFSGNSPSYLVKDITRLKARRIKRTHELAVSEKVQEAVTELMIKTAQTNGCSVSKAVINRRNAFVECQVHHPKIVERNILVRLYNTHEWIYPDSSAIWSLISKASENECIPVLLAPHIHGSCFQLFKSLGMFGRANHFVFISQRQEGVIESISVPVGTEKLYLVGFKFGRHENIEPQSAYGELRELTELLSSTIPKFYHSFSVNLEKTYQKLMPLVVKRLGEQMTRQKEHRSMAVRLDSLSHFLTSAKLRGVAELRKMIKRDRALIDSLN